MFGLHYDFFCVALRDLRDEHPDLAPALRPNQPAVIAAWNVFEAAARRAEERGEANLREKMIPSARWCILQALAT